MRPEDVVIAGTDAGAQGAVPIDVALEAVDTELQAAGAQARRMLNGKRQPTRFFTIELRQVLLDALLAEDAARRRDDRSSA